MAKKKEKTLEEKLQEALVPEKQWPYILPENWCWTRLENINKYRGKSVTPQNNDDILFELYSVPSCENEYPEILTGSKIGSSKQLVEKKDVLLCKINPRINRVWQVLEYTNNTLLASSEWIVVRNRLLNSDYLVWYFKSPYFRECMLSNVSGVGGSLMRAKPKAVMEYPVPLAPLSEQKRIVNRIESLFAKLDEAKEKIQQVLDGAEMRKAAILHKAFTGELTKTWRKENGISEDSWEVKKLSDCGNWYGGGTPSKTHPEYWEKGNILWITSKDMKSDYIEDSQQHINSYGVENSSAKYIEEHALICVMRSGILRHSFPVAVIKKPFTVNQDLKVLVPNKMINIEYLLFICKYKEQSILNSCMKNGTTVESINFDKLKNFSIMIPAEIEQIRIVNIIKKFLCRENDVLNKCNKFITSIATMKKSILAKAFRGELGTNNPTEDSAFNLLKEVLQDKS